VASSLGKGPLREKGVHESAADKKSPCKVEMSKPERADSPGPVHRVLYRLAIWFAYAGGAVVAAIGVMSAIHIIGLWLFSSPVRGDFELVEFGIAIAGTMFIPYCQAARGHIVVDFFTQRASPRTIAMLDSFGSFVMAVTLLLVGWRTAIAIFSIYSSGETTTLRELPIWIAYAAMTPGLLLAGFIALAQGMGLMPATAQDTGVEIK
jgi:TRAP-type C4-dicarboxylate transport system permease small subunit